MKLILSEGEKSHFPVPSLFCCVGARMITFEYPTETQRIWIMNLLLPIPLQAYKTSLLLRCITERMSEYFISQHI